MRRINSEILRSAREEKNWSLEDLAKRSRINAQTIHRIEKGDQKHNRQNVIDALARALGIPEDQLTGLVATSPPEKESDEIDGLLSSSQVNLRVSNRARNALSLTASHYGVTHAQIVEIAPLLFCWAAEQSLRKRREHLAEVEAANQKLEQLCPPHLHAAAFANSISENPLYAERRSIKNNDLFGTSIDGDGYESYLPDDYAEATDNPFAVFLRGLTEELGNLATFSEWDPNHSVEYTVCRSKAVEYLVDRF